MHLMKNLLNQVMKSHNLHYDSLKLYCFLMEFSNQNLEAKFLKDFLRPEQKFRTQRYTISQSSMEKTAILHFIAIPYYSLLMYVLGIHKPRIFEIFTSEFEFRLFLTNEGKKLICMVTQKCVLKNFQKQQCCIYVGWS